MQDLRSNHVLGEYCGVVKTLEQSERDAAAACGEDEHLTGYIYKDKTETFETDVELPGAHSSGENEALHCVANPPGRQRTGQACYFKRVNGDERYRAAC